MYPTFNLLGRTIGLYSVMALIGLLLAGFLGCRIARKRGHDDNIMIALLLWICVGVLAGGHLLYAALNYKAIGVLFNTPGLVKSLDDFWAALQYIFGGAVFYGGLIGGIVAGLIYLKKHRLSLPEYGDMIAPLIPLFHAFGRIGCFLGGCCYGVECSFGFTYTHALIPDANGVSRFPVQLAEAGCNALLFAVLWILLRKGKLKGRLLPLYLLVYAILRFALEFFRGDAARGIFLGVSTSQWISLALFFGAGVWLLLTRRKEETEK